MPQIILQKNKTNTSYDNSYDNTNRKYANYLVWIRKKLLISRMDKQPKQDTLNRRKAFKYKKKGTSEIPKSQQGYKDSNLEMTESEFNSKAP